MDVRRGLLVSALALASSAAPARGAIVDIAVGGASLSFTPSNITIQVGDTVRWTNAGGFHNVVVSGTGGFRCANGCDGAGGNGNPSSAAWSFQRTFNAAGSIHYMCEVHGPSGMTGDITVGGGGGGNPGSLSFTTSNFSIAEGGGSRIVTLRRTGGDDGAVSVQYATANGSATASADFSAQSGILTWPDQDDTNKSLSVPILDDGIVEGPESFTVLLSNPTGGATVGSPAVATVTINDNDSGGSPPAAPSGLTAAALSSSAIRLGWTDNSSNETAFRVEGKPASGTFASLGTTAAGVTSFDATGLAAATAYTFRVRAENATGSSAFSNEATATTPGSTAPCVPGANTLCLNSQRFKVEISWRIPDGTSGQGAAIPLDFAPDSGLFYFFQPTNIELLIKVLNACVPPFDRYWVFYAATTNVEFILTVTDTQTGAVKTYNNALNHAAAPVQDTDAFTCP